MIELNEYDDTIYTYEGCGKCGLITIRVPHKLFTDMIKNCDKSDDLTVLLFKLKKMRKSKRLLDALEKAGIEL